MARPQKDGMDYFPHDVAAASDPKIEPLLLLYGANGYAFYFIHLEYIYREPDFEFDISDAETREVICQKLHLKLEEYEQILQTSLKKNCFDKNYYEQTGKLTSNGVKKRALVVVDKREKMREYYENKLKAETKPETKQKPHKEKKSKVKKSKVNINIIDDKKIIGFGDVLKEYESNFGFTISSAEIEKFKVWHEQDETPCELLIEAIKKSALAGIRNYGYVEGILKNWKTKGIVNLAGIAALDKEWESKKESTENKESPVDKARERGLRLLSGG